MDLLLKIISVYWAKLDKYVIWKIKTKIYIYLVQMFSESIIFPLTDT